MDENNTMPLADPSATAPNEEETPETPEEPDETEEQEDSEEE